MNKAHNLFIPIALAISISLLLIGSDIIKIEKAFAEATITVITPTGGALDATSDCLDITGGSGIVWQNCNSILYAIDYTSGAVIANISIGNVFAIEASTQSTSVYGHDGTGNTLNKYQLSGGIITQTGQVALTCDSNGPVLHYDALGYLWTVCGGSDKVVRVNPALMQVDMVSQALTASCVSPLRIAYSTTDNIGVVYCNTGTNIITFSKTSATAVSILDDEATGEGSTEIMIDGGSNRIIAVSPLVRQVWGYTSGGILTLTTSDTTSNTGACKQEAFANNDGQGIQFLCISDGISGAVATYGFMSNATGVFQILNGYTVFANSNINGMGIDFRTNAIAEPLSPIYYINGNPDNHKFIRITDLRAVVNPEPVPPSGGIVANGTNIIGGVDCDLPENVQTVLCRAGSGGGTIPNAGAFIVGNGSEGTGVTGIACNLGFTDCVENPDIKTNGIGYLFFIAGIAIMLGLFFVISRGQLTTIPTFIWILGILSLAGAMALMEIIDPVVFIISIVAIIALAVPKIMSTIRGDTTLGAGNTT